MIFIDAFFISLSFALGAIGTALFELSLKGAVWATAGWVISSFIYAAIRYLCTNWEDRYGL